MILSGRQGRFRQDCDHVVSKQLVSSVVSGATLVFEDLTDIRTRVQAPHEQRRRLHGWSFHQLQGLVSYKALSRGVRVAYVDARYSSQQCSRCGHISRANRPCQAVFRCTRCRFECHADTHAAINLRNRHLSAAGRPVNRPIVSAQARDKPRPEGRGC